MLANQVLTEPIDMSLIQEKFSSLFSNFEVTTQPRPDGGILLTLRSTEGKVFKRSISYQQLHAGDQLAQRPERRVKVPKVFELADRLIPIIADESCRTSRDIPALVGCVDGVNIKLEKCGSLREGMRIVHAARAHDRRASDRALSRADQAVRGLTSPPVPPRRGEGCLI